MLECKFEVLALVSVKNETKSSWYSMLVIFFSFLNSKLQYNTIENYKIQYNKIQSMIPYCFPTVTYASTDR